MQRILAPGPLSASHAQLLVAPGDEKAIQPSIAANDRCTACHPSGVSELNKPVSVDSIGPVVARKQSQLCMNCHDRAMPDAVHGSPHDLHGNALEELVARGGQNKKSFLSSLVSRQPIDWQNNDTECSQCHREHQGEMHTLQKMASEKCQACHRDQFVSFSKDHPEFRNYPDSTSRNIVFDHNRHRDLHYSKKNAHFDCKACHIQSDQVGVVGQVFRSVSFDTACASCHSEPIKSAIQEGLIVLQVPSINKSEFAKHGLELGDWPMQASQINDGLIPPVMRWLLEAEPGGLQLLDKMPPSGNIADVDMKDPDQREAIAALAKMTKQLIQKLANQGQPGFRSSVERLVSVSVEDAQATPTKGTQPASNSVWLDRFASGVPPDLFRAAYSEWFMSSGVKESTSLSGLQSNKPAQVRMSAQIRSVDDDLLGGNDSLLSPSKSDDLLIQDSDSLLSPGASDLGGNLTTKSVDNAAFQDSKPWNQLSFGGWMIDRQRMAIVYVPRGHADEWLSRWVEMEKVRWQMSASKDRSAKQKRAAFSQQCRVCHVLNVAPKESDIEPSKNWLVAFQQVNTRSKTAGLNVSQFTSDEGWRAKRRAFNLTEITKFDHTPHLNLPSISDCSTCHQLPRSVHSVDLSVEYQRQHEFIPISRAQCTSCHQPNGAGETCTQCHNYHVGNKSWSAH
jgi:hypothetical protein